MLSSAVFFCNVVVLASARAGSLIAYRIQSVAEHLRPRVAVLREPEQLFDINSNLCKYGR